MSKLWKRLIGLAAVATLAAVAAAAALAAAAPSAGAGATTRSITIYSGREQELVEGLFERFTARTGIAVKVRYGDSAELAATILEEGKASPADVFFAQDAGTLGAVAAKGRLEQLPARTLARVPARYRDPGGFWVGTSGRARVIAYNTDLVKPADLPKSVFDLTAAKWRGKVGVPPTNASFQAFVSAMRVSVGDARTRQWLEALQRNKPKLYEKNTPVLEALANGEIALGLVNHYYLFLLKEEQPNAPVANHYLRGRDPGALVNAAGAGIVAGTDRRAEAQRFIDFLLSADGQRYYGTAEEAEYPLVSGIPARKGLPPLASLQGPALSLGKLGSMLESTLVMLSEVGLTS